MIVGTLVVAWTVPRGSASGEGRGGPLHPNSFYRMAPPFALMTWPVR